MSRRYPQSPSRLQPIPFESIREANMAPIDREAAVIEREYDVIEPRVSAEQDMRAPMHIANKPRMRTLLKSPMDRPALMRAIREFEKQTYSTLTQRNGSKFPANYTLQGLISIGEGKYGAAYNTRDGLYVLKRAKREKPSLLHEFFVGKTLANLRDRTPIFTATLGVVKCKKDEFNHRDEVWCKRGDRMTNMVVYEKIDGQSANEFEPSDPLSYFAIYALILHGLQLAYDEYKFTHNDLHGANVIIEMLDRPMFFQISDDLYVLSQYIPRILDYGFARVTVDGYNYVKYYNHGNGYVQPNVILDAFRFFMSNFFKENESDDHYNDVLSGLCHMFTDRDDYFVFREEIREEDLRARFEDTFNAGANVWGLIEYMADNLPSIFFTRRSVEEGDEPLYQCGTDSRPACIDVDSIPIQDTVTVRAKPIDAVNIEYYARYVNWYFNNYDSLTPEERTSERRFLRQRAEFYQDDETIAALDSQER